MNRHWSGRVSPELVCHFKPKYGWGQELGSAGLPVLQGSLDIVTVQRVLTLKLSEFWAGVCLSCPSVVLAKEGSLQSLEFFCLLQTTLLPVLRLTGGQILGSNLHRTSAVLGFLVSGSVF